MFEELTLLANKRDVPYQSLIKVLLSDRIENVRQMSVVIRRELGRQGSDDSGGTGFIVSPESPSHISGLSIVRERWQRPRIQDKKKTPEWADRLAFSVGPPYIMTDRS
jgi:hypothetical protein